MTQDIDLDALERRLLEFIAAHDSFFVARVRYGGGRLTDDEMDPATLRVVNARGALGWDGGDTSEPAVRTLIRWARLGQAWDEAERALAEYALLRVSHVPPWAKYDQEVCEANIEWWANNDRLVESSFADTPAAALFSLAAKLAEPR